MYTSIWAADSTSNSFCKCLHSETQYTVSRAVGQYVVETLKETGHFDFSTRAAFDCAVAMFLCTLTWADSPEKKKKQQDKEVTTLTLLRCCDSRVTVMRRQTRQRFSCSSLQPETRNNHTALIIQHSKIVGTTEPVRSKSGIIINESQRSCSWNTLNNKPATPHYFK